MEHIDITPAAALIIMGLVFLGLEPFLPAFGAAAVTGLLAITLGILSLFNAGNMAVLHFGWNFVWAIGMFGMIVTGIVVLLAARAYGSGSVTGAEGMIGHRAKIVEWSGTAGRVSIQGEIWQAVSDLPMDLEKGDLCRVQAVENLTLRVGADF